MKRSLVVVTSVLLVACASHARLGGPGGTEEATPNDSRDSGSGAIGSGGEAKPGDQRADLEFLAYREQVINTIKARWTNTIAGPGMIAAVRFAIAPDGQVSNVLLAQGSGDPAYDASALRAVEHVGQLPPPPARYVRVFREFVIEFHSEASGGQPRPPQQSDLQAWRRFFDSNPTLKGRELCAIKIAAFGRAQT